MPLESGFEPRSPRYGAFLVLGLFDTYCVSLGPFLAIFVPFLGHIAKLEGKEGLFVLEDTSPFRFGHRSASWLRALLYSKHLIA